MSCEPGKSYEIKYPVGSFVYIEKSAKKGVMEKIRIRSFHVNVSESTFGQPIVIYKDTDNRIWPEKDLCLQEDAILFATDYYNNILDSIDELED